jgi:hypothetical protein
MSGKPHERDTRETADLANLPVDRLPEDAPDEAVAAVDDAPEGRSPGQLAHDPNAARGPRAMLEGYAAALLNRQPGEAADLFAENGAVYSEDRQVNGRSAILRWHEELFGHGRLTARPAGIGNDTARLDVQGPTGPRVVELAFDATGRIGSARWLRPDTAALGQEDRTRMTF